MAATPLATLVQLSERRRTRRRELDDRLAAAMRTANLEVVAARAVLNIAEEAYFSEGTRILLNRRSINVFNVPETREIIGLLSRYQAPYLLGRITVMTANLEEEEIDAQVIQQMRNLLLQAGLVNNEGNNYDIPVAAAEQ